MALNKVEKKKIILGAGNTEYEGWLATDFPFFDIRRKKHWRSVIGKNEVDNLLCEHVLEHLTVEDVTLVLANAFDYLKSGGCLRIAVPDKNHINPEYIDYVRPGGSGPGCDDHRSFWDFQTLGSLAESMGYVVLLQEYYDNEGKYHLKNYSFEAGRINRSRLNPNLENRIKDYSSLVADLIK